MSSLRVAAPRTFTDENAVQHDRVTASQQQLLNATYTHHARRTIVAVHAPSCRSPTVPFVRCETEQSSITTRRGLGAAASLTKPSTHTPPPSAQPTKPTKLTTTSSISTTTTRRALGDITNAKKPSQPTTTHSKPHNPLKTHTPHTTATALSVATPAVHSVSPPPVERVLGMTWREQEERMMEELTTRRDSLTGLTPAELTSSIRHVLTATDKRMYDREDERVTSEWVSGLDVMSTGSGVYEVDERKVQALLELDLDIDLDL